MLLHIIVKYAFPRLVVLVVVVVLFVVIPRADEVEGLLETAGVAAVIYSHELSDKIAGLSERYLCLDMENYEEYIAFRARKAAEKAASVQPKQKKEKPKPKGGTKPLEKKIAKLEREISDLEEKSAAIDEQMSAAASDPGKLIELSEQKDESET